MDDIEDKETKLHSLSEEFDRASKMFNNVQEKTTRDVHSIRSQLRSEQSLKLEAFSRVDELQTHVYDMDQALSSLSRPYTSMSKLSSFILVVGGVFRACCPFFYFCIVCITTRPSHITCTSFFPLNVTSICPQEKY